jgi:hypothetical protein
VTAAARQHTHTVRRTTVVGAARPGRLHACAAGRATDAAGTAGAAKARLGRGALVKRGRGSTPLTCWAGEADSNSALTLPSTAAATVRFGPSVTTGPSLGASTSLRLSSVEPDASSMRTTQLLGWRGCSARAPEQLAIHVGAAA